MSERNLGRSLPGSGIGYEWWGEELGGRRSAAPVSRHPAWRNPSFRGYADHMDTVVFRGALERLEQRAGVGAPVAVMCAETLWWRCHRRLVADALVVRGTDVVHLVDASHRQPHPLHPALRVDDDGWPVYDVGVERPLL